MDRKTIPESVTIDSNVRIALVNQAFVPPGAEIGDTGAHLPGLGLLMLASTISEVRPDLTKQIRYFDEELLGTEGCLNSVSDWVSEASTGLVFITTYTLTHHRQKEFTEKIRKPGNLIFSGGPHVTLHPETSNADIIIRGEGVSAMRHLFSKDRWTAGELMRTPGACFSYRSGNQTLRHFSPPQRILAPDEWPRPSFSYDLIPSDVRHRASDKRDMNGLEPMSIILSKGCPEACHFCSSGAQNGRWAPRSVSRFKEDLSFLISNRKVEAIEFHDDDFLAHPELESVFEIMLEIGIPWNCYGRVDHFVDNGRSLAERLYASGCRRIFLGLESMSESKLEFFNKRAETWMNEHAVTCCAEAGIEVAAGWIIGAPDDTRESLEEELESFLCLPLYSLDVNILSLNPGAVLTKRVLNGGISLPLQGPERENSDLLESNHLLPNPQKYGSQEPWGQPTICKAIDKPGLNELASRFRDEIEFGSRDKDALLSL